jgi:hypothetical protein
MAWLKADQLGLKLTSLALLRWDTRVWVWVDYIRLHNRVPGHVTHSSSAPTPQRPLPRCSIDSGIELVAVSAAVAGVVTCDTGLWQVGVATNLFLYRCIGLSGSVRSFKMVTAPSDINQKWEGFWVRKR